MTQCSKRIYSGQRWDIMGHPCSRKAVVERDGKAYCRQHDPEVERLRRAKQEAEYQARRAEQERLFHISKLNISLLGAGQPHMDPIRGMWTGGVVLDKTEAAELARKLGELEVYRAQEATK